MVMVKRIAVFAVVVLGYVLTGMALSASQSGSAPAALAVEAATLAE